MAPQPTTTLIKRIPPTTLRLLASTRSSPPPTPTPIPTHQQSFSTTPPTHGVNPLLNLSQFSASKEAQYFSKERRIPREEFYPYIELIRSSEVDPFAPSPGASPTVIAALKRAETGKEDVQTAYSLAIHNLISQVQVARGEAVQAHATLARVRERARRDERQAGWIVVLCVGLLAVVGVKTDAVEELKDWVSGWTRWDWEWLGNPPEYKTSSAGGSRRQIHGVEVGRQTHSTVPSPSAPSQSAFMPIEAQLDQRTHPSAFTAQRSEPQPIRQSQSQFQSQAQLQPQQPSSASSRWSPSRLFWSPST